MKPSKFLKKHFKAHGRMDYLSFKAFIRAVAGNEGAIGQDAEAWRKNKGYSGDWLNAPSRPKA